MPSLKVWKEYQHEHITLYPEKNHPSKLKWSVRDFQNKTWVNSMLSDSYKRNSKSNFLGKWNSICRKETFKKKCIEQKHSFSGKSKWIFTVQYRDDNVFYGLNEEIELSNNNMNKEE